MSDAKRAPWWRGAVIYQAYPRSFADSNGDGIGDLRGLADRLDYLAWLGVDGVWLNPIFPSPNADWGYDVADYCGVHPDYGTLDDLDGLVREARRCNLHVLLDLVPNHTSDRHPWFVESRTGRASARRDWYVWADGRPDGAPPNNWASVFGGPAWTSDGASGQWYLHNFLAEQPDLNWWNEGVRDAFDEILRFWFDRGISGFRIDVAHGIVKDRRLRDNPPAAEGDTELIRRHGQKPVYNFNRPEVHDVMRRWRALTDTYESRPALIGETWAPNVEALARYYGNGEDGLHLAFNFDLMTGAFDAAAMRGVVERTEAALPPGALPAWATSNHDLVRFPTRWCGGDDRKVRCALLLALGLRGTVFIYYGDELGMPQAEIPEERRLDPAGRDGARTPLPWSDGPGGGFTAPDAEPWLPLECAMPSVEEQRDDPGSMLRFTRTLIELRRSTPDLRDGKYETVPAPDGAWAWRRGEGTAVLVNLSDEPVTVDGVGGTVVAATDPERRRDHQIGKSVRLEAWEGLVVRLRPDSRPQ